MGGPVLKEVREENPDITHLRKEMVEGRKVLHPFQPDFHEKDGAKAILPPLSVGS